MNFTGLFASLTNPDLISFSVALILLLALVVLEIGGALLGFSLLGVDGDAGLDIDADLDVDMDVDADFDASSGTSLDGVQSGLTGILSFLGIGKVPFGVWLLAFLTLFGITGLIGQQISQSLINTFIPWQIAVPAVFIAISPVLSKFCTLLSRLVPSLETAAVDQNSLISRPARIIQGTARIDLSAQAKVTDVHGNPHYVRVVPMSDDVENGGGEFPTGTNVRLVSVENGLYRAVKLETPS